MKQPELKSADDYARQFKLHHCIGSKKFAQQVAIIQSDAIKSLKALDKVTRPC